MHANLGLGVGHQAGGAAAYANALPQPELISLDGGALLPPTDVASLPRARGKARRYTPHELIGEKQQFATITPMICAYHVIITTYGFWLPNDPRGSWSDWVRQWDLLTYGKATKVETRQSVAKRPHDRQNRIEAKKALKYPGVRFSGRQALAVGVGFKRAIAESGYVVHACSILPQHAHLVIARLSGGSSRSLPI